MSRLRFTPVGDSAVTVPVERASELAQALTAAIRPGMLDAFAAFDAVTVVYDPSRWSFREICDWIETTKDGFRSSPAASVGRVVEIPVSYGGDDGPDLLRLANEKGMPAEALIELHTSGRYPVLAIGFLPGFAYLGGLPKLLHTPRLATPRPRVAAGSLAIGGTYTGVYPLESPGGWNLIGRTTLKLLEAKREPAALLRVGDTVCFRPVNGVR